MAYLIDKDVIITEMETRIKGIEVSQKAGLIKKRDADKKIFLFKSVLPLIDTLEVKEVDLNEEIEKCLKRHNMLAVGRKDFTDIAKHFFELGLKAQKAE